MTSRQNPHIGGSLEDFLKEDGIAEEVRAVAIKRIVALQIEHEMATQRISKSEMATPHENKFLSARTAS